MEHIALSAISPNPQQPRSTFDEERPLRARRLHPRARRHPASHRHARPRPARPLLAHRGRTSPARRPARRAQRRALHRARGNAHSNSSNSPSSRMSSAPTSTRWRKRPPIRCSRTASPSHQEDIAQRVGRSRSAVANTLRLLNLPAGCPAGLDRRRQSAQDMRAPCSPCPTRRYERSRCSESSTAASTCARPKSSSNSSGAAGAEPEPEPSPETALARPAHVSTSKIASETHWARASI